jgi:hypothetical protein
MVRSYNITTKKKGLPYSRAEDCEKIRNSGISEKWKNGKK